MSEPRIVGSENGAKHSPQRAKQQNQTPPVYGGADLLKSLSPAPKEDPDRAGFKTRLVYEKMRNNEGVKPGIPHHWPAHSTDLRPKLTLKNVENFKNFNALNVFRMTRERLTHCLLYTSDAADE